jgi:hypothetical protein
VGYVLFPSQILAQIVDLIDFGLLFAADDMHEKKWERISSIITESFSHYQSERGHLFTIVYATRRDSRIKASFHVAQLTWHPEGHWTDCWIDLPLTSGLITSLGSGEKSIQKWYSKWSKSDQGGTSRSVFSSFCDSLSSAEDPLTGGPPQLVGLYRIGPARSLGIVYRDRKSVLGLPAERFGRPDSIEWRNALFERCDPKTLERLPDAQRHAAPPNLGTEAHKDPG